MSDNYLQKNIKSSEIHTQQCCNSIAKGMGAHTDGFSLQPTQIRLFTPTQLSQNTCRNKKALSSLLNPVVNLKSLSDIICRQHLTQWIIPPESIVNGFFT